MEKEFLLQKIGQAWLNPHYIWRQKAILNAAPEFCLSQPSFALALDWIFAHWTEKNLENLIATSSFPKDIKYLVQILAGTTPAMIAQGFLQGALLNTIQDTGQYIKLPAQQTLFAEYLYQSFLQEAPSLAALFELDKGKDRDAFYHKLKHADCVIAYGSDETMATIKTHLSAGALFIPHGHVESVAVIFKESANKESLEKLAYDMLSYDQRGCLSPHVTFIEEGGSLTPEKFAEQFAETILPKMAAQLPRGGLFEGEAAEILHQRNMCGFRGKVYAGEDWTVCFDNHVTWPKVSLPRFMSIKPFQNVHELIKIFPPLISIGYAGADEKKELLKTCASRIVLLGNMQKQCLVF